MSHRNTKSHQKGENPPHISTFSTPIPEAQPNQHLYHPHNTLPRHQKAPQVKRAQNHEKRTKNRLFSVSSVSQPPDNQNPPNIRRNRLQTDPLHLQKAPQVNRKQHDKKRAQTTPFSHLSVSPPPDNQNRRNIHQNRRRRDLLHPQTLTQVKRKENNRKFPLRHRQLTPSGNTSKMDPAVLEEMRKLVLEVKAISEEKTKILKRMEKIIGEMKTDLKAKGVMPNSSLIIIPPAPHQENSRVVFGHLWGLWKDLKISKTQRPHVFREQGTFSFRDWSSLRDFRESFKDGHISLWRQSLAIYDIFTNLLIVLIISYHMYRCIKYIIFKYSVNGR
jgi:hypothetical protein